jgi:hypothetical protein
MEIKNRGCSCHTIILNYLVIMEEYHVKISNRFAAFKNLDAFVNINMA